ncbi:MAG: FkbM family methyltransferase [Proteobacteria bacterium]|nr:FkbM family methyltransferase [Pseudomonadota bacterium]
MLSSAYATLRDRGPGALAGAVWNIARGNLHRRVLGRRFLEKRIHDYRLLLDLEDRGISRALLLFGTREVDHKIILERILRPGMTVFDIGANIGYYVLMELGLLQGRGRVIAIEPSPGNVRLLRRNLALNGHDDIEIIEGAVSDSEDVRAFHLSGQSNLGTFHPVGSGAAHLSGDRIDVKTCTVPALAAEYGAPDLIRMDVEGHEVEVIGGMTDAIRAGELAPMILFETHLSRYSDDHDMAAVLRALFGCGYRVGLLSSSYERGTRLIDDRGYHGSAPIPTDGVARVIYDNIADDDAIDFICRCGGARTVLLAPPAQSKMSTCAASSDSF